MPIPANQGAIGGDAGGNAGGVTQADVHQEQDKDYPLDIDREEEVDDDDDAPDEEDEEIDEEDLEFKELVEVAKVRSSSG